MEEKEATNHRILGDARDKIVKDTNKNVNKMSKK